MSTPDRTYTLDDLTRLTGFTARQIRYYVTRKLVPGAGERGPNVRYGQASLDRLELIRRLKEIEVQPAGRSLTLDEIRKTIDTLGEDGARQMLVEGAELSILDTDETALSKSCDAGGRWTETASELALPESRSFRFQEDRRPYAPEPESLGELGGLLRSLESMLTDILETDDDPRNDPAQTGAEQWRRVRIPDIEIQVRRPDDRLRRERLERIHGILRRHLDQGRYGP